MIYLAIAFFCIGAFVGIMFGAGVIERKWSQAYERQSTVLWQHINDLEADKRALTESLCRAEGKPFIRHNEPLKPSEGWWDGQPEVKAKIS